MRLTFAYYAVDARSLYLTDCIILLDYANGASLAATVVRLLGKKSTFYARPLTMEILWKYIF